MTLPHLDEAAVLALGPAAAADALEQALRDGLDPAKGVPRSFVDVPAGELIIMPAAGARHVGTKLVGVAPRNAERGLPRIGAVYVLFDATTMQPVATLDGTALTTLRTPATSVVALRPWLRAQDSPRDVVVFGAGPQGVGHVDALAAEVPLGTVTFVVRRPDAVTLPTTGPAAAAGLLASDDPRVAEALGTADVVVCATTARTPVFDPGLLGADRPVLVAAVGSHEPEAAEVDIAYTRSATVVVEDVATALRECGDVVQAVDVGAVFERDLVPLAAVARGEAPVGSGRVLFKGSGMAWQDLVVAEAVLDAYR
ncbi:ornithine cyclodeaminase family protein [Microlunatus flavus]|uniref:Ornithine cyclodeaminase n=1 Tax=Microlunatus flavus TaxID=1036181 RepID=A0A1H9HC54_9ACTN|nr:ornithine cyclodeaminase family protein [Microlunatus flavus]SEQ59867.1 ornithine cyclodeaminase [Microlunatus flavus]